MNIITRNLHKSLPEQLNNQLRLSTRQFRSQFNPWTQREHQSRGRGSVKLLHYSKTERFSIGSLVTSLLSKMSTPDKSSPPEVESNKGASGSGERAKFRATKEELKSRLSPIQYQVTQLKSTERPGSGEYNKFNEKGTYCCIVCDEELFKSDTKYNSGCGWPAFFDSIDLNRLKFVKDYALVGAADLLLLAKKADLVRTEVLCAHCDAHLGHRFDDGPISKGGKRYCINSAALKFYPRPAESDSK